MNKFEKFRKEAKETGTKLVKATKIAIKNAVKDADDLRTLNNPGNSDAKRVAAEDRLKRRAAERKEINNAR